MFLCLNHACICMRILLYLITALNTNKLAEVISGVIRGRELPFPEQRKDPCSTAHLSPACPIKKGQLYLYRATFEIKPFYPPVKHLFKQIYISILINICKFKNYSK